MTPRLAGIGSAADVVGEKKPGRNGFFKIEGGVFDLFPQRQDRFVLDVPRPVQIAGAGQPQSPQGPRPTRPPRRLGLGQIRSSRRWFAVGHGTNRAAVKLQVLPAVTKDRPRAGGAFPKRAGLHPEGAHLPLLQPRTPQGIGPRLEGEIGKRWNQVRSRRAVGCAEVKHVPGAILGPDRPRGGSRTGVRFPRGTKIQHRPQPLPLSQILTDRQTGQPSLGPRPIVEEMIGSPVLHQDGLPAT